VCLLNGNDPSEPLPGGGEWKALSRSNTVRETRATVPEPGLANQGNSFMGL